VLKSVQLINTLVGHKDAVYALAKYPGYSNNVEIISGGGDGYIISWDVNKPDLPGKMVAKVNETIYSLIYDVHNRIICGTRGGGLYVLDPLAGAVIQQIQLIGDVFKLYSVNAKTICALTSAGEFYVFDSDLNGLTTRKALLPCRKSGRSIVRLAGKLYTGWSDGCIRIFKIIDEDVVEIDVEIIEQADKNSVFALTTLQDFLISGGRDAQLKQWAINDAGLDHLLNIPAHLFTINDMVNLSEPKLVNHIVTASRDKSIKIWEMEAGQIQLRKVLDKTKYLGMHTHSVNKLMALQNGLLISAGDDRKICIWKIESE